MDKILHSPNVLSVIERHDCQATTTMPPFGHPRIQCCEEASWGSLTCARFCPLSWGVMRGCAVRINIKEEWASGELTMWMSGVAQAKPVQDFVHQLSCG